MSQQPPTGPDDDTGRGADGTGGDGPDASAATPDQPGGEETEVFASSPYDVPEPGPATPQGEPDAVAPYGQAPDPSQSGYTRASATEPVDDAEQPGRRRRWLVPVIVVVILLVAGAIATALLLGGDDEDEQLPAPTDTATSEQPTDDPTEPTEEPTDDPTDATDDPDSTEEPTEATEDPTEEPEEPTDTAPEGELLDDLDTSVEVGDMTFELAEDWAVDDAVVSGGILEAYRGVFTNGEDEIRMRATYWPDNEAADAFAAELIDALGDAEEVESGDTYTNGDGTFWAFLREDGSGAYVWTTDRGHTFQVIGSTDYVGPFYSNFPL